MKKENEEKKNDSDTDYESFTESQSSNRESEADEDRDDEGRSNVAEANAENNFQEETLLHQPRRISQRSTKGIAPQRLTYDTLKITDNTKEPRTLSEALSSENKMQWIRAMEEKIKSLEKNKTWRLCKLPEGRTAIGCKWVYKAKQDTEGKVRFKAQLVAQGFSQKYGLDYDQIFAPVVRQATFRTLLTIASKEEYVVRHLDFKTAFLNGKIKEEIYMKQLSGFIKNGKEQQVCLLQKSIYGLKQAAKSWHDELHNILIKVNFTQGNTDPCLYIKRDREVEWCFLIVYVDDMVVAAKTNEIIDKLIETIGSVFEVKDLGDIKLYLDIEITKDDDGIYNLCQSKYIQKVLTEFGLEDAKVSNIPMNVGYLKTSQESNNNLLLSNKNYQKLIGCLLYISVNTRPDISASISILAQKVTHPTQEDWNELKRVLKYLKGTMYLKLRLGNKKSKNELLYGYADANWAENKTDRKSNSGYAFFVNGGMISWRCRKQSIVALSTMEAEFIALSEACKEMLWLRRLLGDMQQSVDGPSKIYEDNQSCLKFVETERLSNLSKHIDTRDKFVKDYVDRKIIVCEYCPTEIMVADMTKPLNVQRLEKLKLMAGLIQ